MAVSTGGHATCRFTGSGGTFVNVWDSRFAVLDFRLEVDAIQKGTRRSYASHAWDRGAIMFFWNGAGAHVFLRERATTTPSLLLRAELSCPILRKLGTEVPTFFRGAELECHMRSKTKEQI